MAPDFIFTPKEEARYGVSRGWAVILASYVPSLDDLLWLTKRLQASVRLICIIVGFRSSARSFCTMIKILACAEQEAEPSRGTAVLVRCGH